MTPSKKQASEYAALLASFSNKSQRKKYGKDYKKEMKRRSLLAVAKRAVNKSVA